MYLGKQKGRSEMDRSVTRTEPNPEDFLPKGFRKQHVHNPLGLISDDDKASAAATAFDGERTRLPS
jgi:hypothetical protein